MDAQTETPNYNRLPPNAVKGHIARAATLEDAEAIFAAVKPTPMAVAAITARREGRPVNMPAADPKPRTAPAKASKNATRPVVGVALNGTMPAPAPGITVVGVDAQAAAVAALNKRDGGGMIPLRDFNERPPSQTSVPKWLRDLTVPYGLQVCRIAKDQIDKDPRSAGDEAYVKVITATLLPGVPLEYLDERGFLSWKDQYWCVGFKENFDRDRQRNRKEHAEKTQAANPRRRLTKDATARGEAFVPVDAGILPGTRVSNPLQAHIDVNKSLDSALGGA